MLCRHHCEREKGYFFRIGDKCRVYCTFKEEFEHFEQLQLFPVGEVVRVYPERDGVAVRTEHFLETLICHYPNEQLELLAPYQFDRDYTSIVEVRSTHHMYHKLASLQKLQKQ